MFLTAAQSDFIWTESAVRRRVQDVDGGALAYLYLSLGCVAVQQFLSALLHGQLQLGDVRLQLLRGVHVELHQAPVELVQQAVLQQLLRYFECSITDCQFTLKPSQAQTPYRPTELRKVSSARRSVDLYHHYFYVII